MKKFVEFLRTTRLQLNYKQEYVAEKLEVATSTISRWENGETELTLHHACRYAEVLGLELREVFAFLANEEQPHPIGEIHSQPILKRLLQQSYKLLSSKN